MAEFIEIPNRGHALTIDSGWREVADTALAFVNPDSESFAETVTCEELDEPTVATLGPAATSL